MDKLRLTQIGTFTALAVLILAFQNCSDVNFSNPDANGPNKVKDTTPSGEEETQEHEQAESDGEQENNEDPEDIKKRYLKFCQMLDSTQFNAVEVGGPDSSIENQRGKLFLNIVSSPLEKIQDVRGNLQIVSEGKEGQGHIGSISHTRGHLVACGVSIGSIEDHRGNITVVDGDIGEVKRLRGNVRLVRGHVDKLDNIRGNVREIATKK